MKRFLQGISKAGKNKKICSNYQDLFFKQYVHFIKAW